MIRIPATALGLGLVYAMTLTSSDPLDLLMGTAVGGALLLWLGTRLRPRSGKPVARTAAFPLWFCVFVGAVVVDVLRGTWDVALRVVHVRRLEHPGFIRVPIGDRSERGVAVTALAVTLSPGSVLVDVDEERAEMVLHLMDASDPDEARRDLLRFYERYQRRVFP